MLKMAIFLEILVAGCVGLAMPQAPGGEVVQPSLGELARKVRAERKEQRLANVPFFTNDNLPKDQGLGVIGPSNPQSVSPLSPPERQQEEKEKLTTLRYKLSQALRRLQIDQREAGVLQKELSQNNMQYYPNPNQTLVQEYNRKDINNLTKELYAKRQQIADDQQAVNDLQSQVESAQSRWGSVNAGQLNRETAPAPPIAAKPGTKAYWRVKLERAQQQLRDAKERESLAGNELRLLQIEQVRTLDPNAQAGLGAEISAKQDEVKAAQQAVEAAESNLEDVKERMKVIGASEDGINENGHPSAAHSN